MPPERQADAPILIVEDDEGLGLLMARHLRRAGHQVEVARSGAQARTRLAEGLPKLMLLDWSLGDTDAGALLDSLPESLKVPPFIVTTGQGSEKVAVTMMQRGARDYLVKDAALLDLLPTVVERTLKGVAQERRLLDTEAQLRHQDKLVGLGQMAAGVAHEINNPMGFLTSNLGTLQEYLQYLTPLLAAYRELAAATKAGGHEVDVLSRVRELEEQEDLDYVLKDAGTLLAESLEGARRVTEIVRNLKSFARLDEAALQVADLNAIVDSSIKVVSHMMKNKVTLRRETAALPALRCYPGQLGQVVVNLLVNACQAIETKGEIRVQTALDGQDALVHVGDSGCGIPPEIRARIFDPFFTTKPVGQGTGLGLSIAFGIIQRHGGRIEVQSEPGQGSIFTIRLPLSGVPEAGVK